MAHKGKSVAQINIFHLTWPIFIEVLLFMMMGIADTFMLSALSDRAVSGVGVANQYIQVAILILEVVGNGASIVVAQYLGSKKYLDATKITAAAVTMNLVVGLVISVCFIIFSSQLMTMMNLQGEVHRFATQYLVIVGGGIFLQAVINALAAIIRVHGWTKQTMYVSLGMNLLHVIGNYLLIFGNFGFPEWGVKGAAISSVLSRLIALVVFFWLLYQVLEYRVKITYYVRIAKDHVKKILQIGIPAAMEQVLYEACQIVFLYYVTYLGTESLAARQYAANISMFTYLFAIAIGMGTAIMIGRFVGANEKDAAYTRLWQSLRWSLLFTLLTVGLIMIFRYQLVGLFTNNQEVIEIAATVLLLSILLETGRTFNIVIISSLRATGDARFPVVIGFISMVCFSLPLGYLFVFVCNFGLVGIWLAIAADEWLRATLVFFRWRSRKWERYSLVSPNKSV